MRPLLIARADRSDYGTFGVLTLAAFQCYTLELPWRNNLSGISCVPAGFYVVEPWSSKKYKRALHVMDVPQRDGILIHQGNWAGDRSQGYLCNVLGCILVGNGRGLIKGQVGVAGSVATLAKLCDLITAKMDLEIRE